jgi:Tfp pilus assembly protein PilV
MKISKSATFLFELMIVILVFSISAAVCMNIFVKAFNFSSDSENLTRAVLQAESALEEFKANPQAAEERAMYFTEDWVQTGSPAGASFVMTVTPALDGNIYTCDVKITQGGAELYALSAKRYAG